MSIGGPSIYPSSGSWLGIAREIGIGAEIRKKSAFETEAAKMSLEMRRLSGTIFLEAAPETEPEQIASLQEALNRLQEDEKFKGKIIVLPPGIRAGD